MRITTIPRLILVFVLLCGASQWLLAAQEQEPNQRATELLALIQQSVEQGDKKQIPAAVEELTELHDRVPAWVSDILESVSSISADQQEMFDGIQQMTADAQSFSEQGDLEGALAAQESAMLMAEDTLGPEHWLTVAATRDMGFIYRQMGNAEQADSFYNQALVMASNLLGENHPQVQEIYELLAELYSAAGATDESKELSENIIQTLSETLGAGHQRTINARLNLVKTFELAGLYDEALVYLANTCIVIEENYSLWHPQALQCELEQARMLTTTGDLDQAISFYDEVIARMGESYTTVDASVLGALNELAEIYREQGDYVQAKDLLAGVIETSTQISAPEITNLAKSYLGRVFNNEGDFESAQLVTEQVLDYGLDHWQDQPLNIYNTLLELGSIYQHQGKLAVAEATFEEALQGLQENYGDTNPATLVALNDLGQVYEQSGLYDEAEPILKEALGTLETTLGPDNQQTSRARNNLALLYESQGNFREAEPLYKHSIEILEKTRGDDYTDTIAVRNNLAFLYMLMQDYDQAANIFVDVRQKWLQLFGENHQFTMKATNNLGRVYHKLGRLDEAEQYILQALELRKAELGDEHLDVIRSMIDLGAVYIDEQRLSEADELLTKAVERAERNLGNEHPYTFEALNNLALAKEKQNKLQAALDLREIGFNRRSDFLDRMLWVTGENAREGYIRLHRPELNAYLALLAKIDDEQSGKRVIEASLQRKGFLLKVTSEIQQISKLSSDPKLRKVADELAAARKELAALTLSGPTAETKGRHVEVLYQLEQKVNELQGEMGRASARFRSSIADISVDTLATVLPEGAALVDYLSYEQDGKDKMIAGIARKVDGEVKFSLVKYDDRNVLNDAIIEYRTIIQDDQADEDELLELGQIAYDEIWQPLNDAIDEAGYVYLIPDGVLNILPFNALIDEDEEYLIRSVDIHTLTSGRDLLPNSYQLAAGETIIIAGPDYDSEDVVSDEDLDIARGKRSASLQLGIRGAGGGLRGLNFSPLPGAEEEGRLIASEVEVNAATNEFFTGSAAQEQVLSNLQQPPEILHMATHGFFLKADDSLRKRLLKLQRGADLQVPPPGDNPLLRAGMAFAGINNNAQFLGDIDTQNDGVLTALEVLDLNLSGTKLVVLSACETGLGEIHEGEGVYGLRRSFQEAGVAEVISSLWEVSDAGTQALMTDLYSRILQGTPARTALRETQIALMDSPEWGYPYIWSAFMIVGSYESSGIAVQ